MQTSCNLGWFQIPFVHYMHSTGCWKLPSSSYLLWWCCSCCWV